MAEKKQRALLRQFVAASSQHDPAAPPPPAPALGFGEAERSGARRSGGPGDPVSLPLALALSVYLGRCRMCRDVRVAGEVPLNQSLSFFPRVGVAFAGMV